MTNNKTYYVHLLGEIQAGKQPPERALSAIRSQLEAGAPQADPYTLLHILGLAKDLSSTDLVAKYLDFNAGDPDDAALVRRIAVQVLGRMWGLQDFFDPIASKAFHDESPYVQAAAATALGYLGSKHQDLRPKTAGLLVHGFDSGRLDEPEVWESFYIGLLELFEIPVSEWPLLTRPLRDTDIRWELVERARELADNAYAQKILLT